LVGGIIYRILYLGGYDAGKTEVLHYKQHRRITTNTSVASSCTLPQQSLPPLVPSQLSWTERFVLAQIIALLAGTMTYPFDSVRRRMMMQAGVPILERLYINSIHCTIQIWKKEGIRGFYLGLGPNLVRSVGGALILVGYDGIRTIL
jgi:solute carrier family 25 (adenine nucleotide translocator) protein 4/5/6/31